MLFLSFSRQFVLEHLHTFDNFEIVEKKYSRENLHVPFSWGLGAIRMTNFNMQSYDHNRYIIRVLKSLVVVWTDSLLWLKNKIFFKTFNSERKPSYSTQVLLNVLVKPGDAKPHFKLYCTYIYATCIVHKSLTDAMIIISEPHYKHL